MRPKRWVFSSVRKQKMISVMWIRCILSFAVILFLANFVWAQSYDLEGFFMPKGRLEKGFTNIDHLYLWGRGTSGAYMTNSRAIDGWIQLTDNSRFKISGPTLIHNNFNFRTSARSGISYEFTGRF